MSLSAMNPERKYRFHLLGLVHLPVNRTFSGCAFTMKIWRLAAMLRSYGHEVFLYGAEGTDAPCTEFVQTHTVADIRQEWGAGDNRACCDGLGYDWRSLGFRHDLNTERSLLTYRFYDTCIKEIRNRARDDDFLLLTQGVYQKPISEALDLYLTCEPGIGYRGSFARFRAFESSFIQNFTYGSEHPGKCVNGHYYDRVIPNYFDAESYPFEPVKEDYFLYMGRLITRKGLETAVKTTQAIGARLVIAGQGHFDCDLDHVTINGYADPAERAWLMGRAQAVFVPTLYLEPFGGVAVEAMLCGTPAITTDFGVFPETVAHGVSGFRCHTLRDFVNAARTAHLLEPSLIRKHAERYLMSNVRHDYQQWWDDLYQLYLSAIDPNVKGWHYLPEGA